MKNKSFLVLSLAAVLVLNSGCALLVIGGLAAGAGAVVYVNGELKDTEAVAYDNAYSATLAAMNDLSYAVVNEQKSPITATITARGMGDKKIQVTLDKQSDTVTEIRVRVGTFGDKDQAQLILDKIKSHF